MKFSPFRRFSILSVTLGLLATTATAAVAPEAQRHIYNSQRIAKLHPWEQAKAGAVLADLESHGDHPLIQPTVWRTAKEQAALKAQGRSTLSYGFHNVTGPKGEPQSLAFDTADYYKGYKVGNDFWLRLASAAQSHELTTGIYWGRTEFERDQIRQAILSKNWGAKIVRGWDPSHSEPVPWIITVSQAKRGLRPVIKKPPAKK